MSKKQAMQEQVRTAHAQAEKHQPPPHSTADSTSRGARLRVAKSRKPRPLLEFSRVPLSSHFFLRWQLES
jgi:hypothetical protein